MLDELLASHPMGQPMALSKNLQLELIRGETLIDQIYDPAQTRFHLLCGNTFSIDAISRLVAIVQGSESNSTNNSNSTDGNTDASSISCSSSSQKKRKNRKGAASSRLHDDEANMTADSAATDNTISGSTTTTSSSSSHVREMLRVILAASILDVFMQALTDWCADRSVTSSPAHMKCVSLNLIIDDDAMKV